MRTLVLATLALPFGAWGADLYRCTDQDGLQNYVSKPVPGLDCTHISTYDEDGRWQYVITGADGATLSFDRKTVVKHGADRTIWVQSRNGQTPRYVPGIGNVQRSLTRVRFSCSAMTSEILSFADYGVGGEVLKSGTYLTPSPASPVAPDTVYEAVLDAICQPNT